MSTSIEEHQFELIGRYADGQASSAETTELNTALKADAKLRRAFLQYMNIDSALGASAPSELPHIRAKSNRRIYGVGLAIIATAAVVLIAVLLMQNERQNETNGATTYATLVAAKDAVWSDSNIELALHAGQLPAGVLRLDSGSAEFLLRDGATVLLRGPVVLEFRGAKRVFVEQGQIFCRCPTPPSRISVETPTTEVIDLGTEFSVAARADQSTLVAVLQGEVQVGKNKPQVLRTGEAVEVRGDGILAIKPIDEQEFAELLAASPSTIAALRQEKNLLTDPGFEQDLSKLTWNGTTNNLQTVINAGRSGNAVRISSDGIAHWPQCRQEIITDDLAGQLVVATVWAAPDREPLLPRQKAMLKIAFLDEHGRDFAFSIQRFLDTKSVPNQYERAQVAAIAPSGARRVQVQLMFQTNLREGGAVLIDDAALVISPTPLLK